MADYDAKTIEFYAWDAPSGFDATNIGVVWVAKPMRPADVEDIVAGSDYERKRPRLAREIP